MEQIRTVEEEIKRTYDTIESLESQINEYENEYYESTLKLTEFDYYVFFITEYDLSKRKIVLKEPLAIFLKTVYGKMIENLNMMYRTKNQLDKELYRMQYGK